MYMNPSRNNNLYDKYENIEWFQHLPCLLYSDLPENRWYHLEHMLYSVETDYFASPVLLVNTIYRKT